MSKHTAGPWKVRGYSTLMNISGTVHQITNDEGFPAAFIPAWDRPDPGEIAGTAEAKANACLIAVAPEMLEVLLDEAGWLRGQIESLAEHKPFPGWFAQANTYRARLNPIEAIIAKASRP